MATAAPAIKIGPADNGRRMTLAEFLDAEEVPGYRYELARRVIEVSEVPNDPHGLIVDTIHTHFVVYRLANPGLIIRIAHASDVQIVIPWLGTDRHPDLAIVFRGKAPDDRGRCMPDLVVEVASSGKKSRDRDYVAKRKDYLAFGLLEYWIVDLLDRRVTVLSRPDADAAWTERTFGDGDAIVSPLLPGFAVVVSNLLTDAAVEGGE